MRNLAKVIFVLSFWLLPSLMSRGILRMPEVTLWHLRKQLESPQITREAYLEYLDLWEGGLANLPQEHGGPTNRGVTYATFVAISNERGCNWDSLDFLRMPDSILNRVVDEFHVALHGDSIASSRLLYAILDYSWGSGLYGARIAVKRILQNLSGEHVEVDYSWGPQDVHLLNTLPEEALLQAISESRYSVANRSPEVYRAGLNNRLDYFCNRLLTLKVKT